ncbi:MAG: M15 family metallopeptidase [Cyclobacteriaceae bacterium]|nr:M15 family metallopeptidase [Cyclobacteriaceae bacterium]
MPNYIQFLFILSAGLLISCSDSNRREKAKNQLEEADTLSNAVEPYVFDEIEYNSDEGRREIGKLEQRMIDVGLIDIQSLERGIIVEMKYATADNFVQANVYGDLTRCYLQPDVAKKLVAAYHYLQTIRPDLTLHVYDCARPRSVQQIFWDLVDVPEKVKHHYVARPEEGSIHNYGCAVDLTLANASTGEILDMGTEFDYFGREAHTNKEQELVRERLLTNEQVENRILLREVMTKAGFTHISSEWWHFNATSRERARQMYEIIE